MNRQPTDAHQRIISAIDDVERLTMASWKTMRSQPTASVNTEFLELMNRKPHSDVLQWWGKIHMWIGLLRWSVHWIGTIQLTCFSLIVQG